MVAAAIAVNGRIGMIGFNEADMVEEKFIAARRAQLALLEQHADFRRGAVHVVGINLNDDGHVMRRAAFIGDMLHNHLFVADARALVDGALDGLLWHACPLGICNGKPQPRIVFRAALCVVAAVILNRLNVAWFRMLPMAETVYIPSWQEIVVTLMVVFTEIWVFRWIVTRMPVFSKK